MHAGECTQQYSERNSGIIRSLTREGGRLVMPGSCCVLSRCSAASSKLCCDGAKSGMADENMQLEALLNGALQHGVYSV